MTDDEEEYDKFIEHLRNIGICESDLSSLEDHRHTIQKMKSLALACNFENQNNGKFQK